MGDSSFIKLMKMISPMSEEDIFKLIVERFNKLSPPDRKRVTDYYLVFPFWGKLLPDEDNYEALRRRASVLYNHKEDLEWLHSRLSDELSKNVLCAILSNWLGFDYEMLSKCTELEKPEYYHTDIFPFHENSVLVDVGAYTGDSVAHFIVTYGVTFKRIYCYEIAPDTFSTLEENLAGIPNIELRQKAAGAKAATMFIDFGQEVSSERVSDTGETAIEVIAIDDDIKEPITFLKMDIEGAEKDALRGCRRHIREDKPRLAICTYHGYDDIYEIPRLIEEIQPGYKFYMRYHGGVLIPTEFSLLAVWDENSSN